MEVYAQNPNGIAFMDIEAPANPYNGGFRPRLRRFLSEHHWNLTVLKMLQRGSWREKAGEQGGWRYFLVRDEFNRLFRVSIDRNGTKFTETV